MGHYCGYCAGAKQRFVEKGIDDKHGMIQERIYFAHPPDVETDLRRIPLTGANLIGQLERVTDIKSGTVVDLHYCFIEERLLFQTRGPYPETKSERKRLNFLLNYAFRRREARGQGRAKGVDMDDILEAIASEPKAGYVRLALMLGVSERTIREKLKPLGGLKKARDKKRQTKNFFDCRSAGQVRFILRPVEIY